MKKMQCCELCFLIPWIIDFFTTQEMQKSLILQVVCNNSLQNSRKIGISIILNCLCRGLHIMITNQCLFENV